MKWLAKTSGLLATALTLGCVATVGAQLTGLILASQQGLLTSDKMVRYAGVLYGLDPLDLAPAAGQTSAQSSVQTREQILAARVLATPHVAECMAAVTHDTEDVRGLTLSLQRSREKYLSARDGFAALLDQLESETDASSLRELQVTLQNTAPKQAKDILNTMLTTAPADPTDDVMADVTELIKSMPDSQLRKILAEFKTEEDRVLLNRLLIEIGELNSQSAQLSGTRP